MHDRISRQAVKYSSEIPRPAQKKLCRAATLRRQVKTIDYVLISMACEILLSRDLAPGHNPAGAILPAE
jgi:hypothetical protein